MAKVFSSEFCEISKNNYFIEYLRLTVSISCRLHWDFQNSVSKMRFQNVLVMETIIILQILGAILRHTITTIPRFRMLLFCWFVCFF